MQPYFIWKGINSLEKGIVINKLPDDIKAEANIEKINIPGRNGFVTQDDGTYQGIVESVECTLMEGSISDLCGWLTGSGDVIFSHEPDKVYKAVIINQISFSKLLQDIRKFIVIFDCQPFAYALDNPAITLTAAGKIYNPGTIESEPYIKVYGSGNVTLTVNESNVNLYNIAEYVTIDSVLQDAYKDFTLKNNDMQGDFPVLKVGKNQISWTGNVTKVVILPNWRWL